MDIAALLLACSVHADDALQLSIAYVHGRGNPYAVLDVRWRIIEQEEPDVVSPSSLTAARAAVGHIRATGGEPVLGLLPARPEWALEFGKTLDDLLDPCGNVAIASAKLSEFDYACRSHGPLRFVGRRSCTLDLYGKSLGLPGLRRAVVSDLTLPSPFPSGQVDVTDSIRFEGSLGGDSGLFFAPRPLVPAPLLQSESATGVPEERP